MSCAEPGRGSLLAHKTTVGSGAASCGCHGASGGPAGKSCSIPGETSQKTHPKDLWLRRLIPAASALTSGQRSLPDLCHFSSFSQSPRGGAWLLLHGKRQSQAGQAAGRALSPPTIAPSPPSHSPPKRCRWKMEPVQGGQSITWGQPRPRAAPAAPGRWSSVLPGRLQLSSRRWRPAAAPPLRKLYLT